MPNLGDSTAQTTPVTSSLAPEQQSGSTGTNSAVSTSQTLDASGLIAQYEKRVRDLMSEKDKAIDERNKAIAQLTDLQNRFTTIQEQSQSSLTAAANSTQQAIDYGKQLEVQFAILKAENTRANAILKKPHLAPYAAFIPADSDETKVMAAIEQLEEINKQQMARVAPQQALPPQLPTLTQPNVAPTNLLDLYAGRPTMAPLMGSAPAQMNPITTPEDQVKEIQKLFEQARLSGKHEDYERARDEAILRANASINAVTGRSS